METPTVTEKLKGLKAAAAEVGGVEKITHSYEKGWEYNLIVTIRFHPIVLNQHTYHGVYARVKLRHDKYWGDMNVYQSIAGQRLGNIHPHVYRGRALICYGGRTQFCRHLEKGEYVKALMSVFVYMTSVHRGHWRRGVTVCDRPGCNESTGRDMKYCREHTPMCVTCGRMTDWPDDDGDCASCAFKGHCTGCGEFVKRRIMDRVKVGDWHHYMMCEKCMGELGATRRIGGISQCQDCKQYYYTIDPHECKGVTT